MPFSSQTPFDVAVVQASSVFLDREASLQKVGDLATEAALNGAKLVLFPEAFIPGYPRGLSFGATVGSRSAEGRALFRRYADAAITGPGPDTIRLGEIAADLEIYLAVGLVEKDSALPGTLFCGLALWGPDGTLLNLHRKIKPTASERLIWGEGDGMTISTAATDIGAIGGLICWENMMPLARTALYNQGIELYLAPTADSRESWQATIRHIALEGRCFVLSCNQYVTKSDYPNDLGKASMREIEALDNPLCRGGSAIVGPLGDYLAGPLWALERRGHSLRHARPWRDHRGPLRLRRVGALQPVRSLSAVAGARGRHADRPRRARIGTRGSAPWRGSLALPAR